MNLSPTNFQTSDYTTSSIWIQSKIEIICSYFRYLVSFLTVSWQSRWKKWQSIVPSLITHVPIIDSEVSHGGTSSRNLQKNPYRLLQLKQIILHKMVFPIISDGIQGNPWDFREKKKPKPDINLFCMIFHPSLLVLKKAQHFWLIALKHKTKCLFLLTFLITKKYLSLQCFLFGHGAQSSFYSHFFLKLRKRKECLRVLKSRWDKIQEAEKIKYLEDFCVLKPENFQKNKEPEMKLPGAGTKGQRCKLPWPLHKLPN